MKVKGKYYAHTKVRQVKGHVETFKTRQKRFHIAAGLCKNRKFRGCLYGGSDLQPNLY